MNPQDTLPKLYRFVGVDFRPEYLQYDLGRDPYPARWDWVPETREQFNPHHARKWQQQMTKEDIQRVSERADDFIEKYSYRDPLL